MKRLKRFILIFVSLAIIGVAFASGVFLGYQNRPYVEKITSLANKETDSIDQVDFEPFWSAWSAIESKYVSNNDIDRQKMLWGAISGLAGSLGDPYTVFFPPKESEGFKEEMNGNFQGVGMEVAIRDEILTVVSPLKGTPAEKAGIKAGDKVLKVNGVSTADMSIDEAVSHIRGKKGSTVTLTVLHKDSESAVEVPVVRDVIQIPIINTEEKPNGVFIIKLYTFTSNSPVLFRKALREFIVSGDDKLVLDLRGNPGGYLESAVDIASWFLPVGKIVAREKFGNGEENQFRSVDYDVFTNLPLVVLVNEGSASASEILAGALQEHGVAKLVGQKTFGKGSVQELVDIAQGSSLKLTIAKWLTPNGHSISEVGIEPDVAVEMTAEDIENGRDPQLDKAIEILKEM